MRQSAAQDIPKIVRESAAKHQIGPPLIVYQAAKRSVFQRLISAFAIAVGCLLIGAFFFFDANVFNGWPQWQALVLLGVGGCWLGLGAWMLLFPLSHPSTCVYLCPGGLIYVKRDIEIIRWQQIRRFWKDMRKYSKAQKAHAYKLLRSDGRTFTFTNELPNVEALGRHLEKIVLQRLLPRAITAYNAHAALDFDAIGIDWQGISTQREQKRLPWSELDRVEIDNSTMRIYTSDQPGYWSAVKVRTIPNLAVLKHLIQHAQRDFASSQSPQIVTYKAGLAVCFGPLSVSQRGISLDHGKELLPWSEIAGIGVGEGEVIIKRLGSTPQWHALPLWMISDTTALKDLLEYIVQGQE